MSSKSSVDPRVRRSRRWLQDALKALVQERAYESITVIDLAARAEVNRTTFYQHFRDKEALLDSIVSDLLEPLFEESDAYLAVHPMPPRDQAPPFLVHLFDRVGAEAGFYRHMLGRSGSPFFVGRLISALEEAIALRPAPSRAVPHALKARFLALGLIGSLSWWLENDTAATARQAADWSWLMTVQLADT